LSRCVFDHRRCEGGCRNPFRLADAENRAQAKLSCESPWGCHLPMGKPERGLPGDAIWRCTIIVDNDAVAPRLLRARNSERTFNRSPRRFLLAPLFSHTPP
jgi:hypothetical protein